MTTQMLYIATIGEKTVFVGKCDKTLEAWRTAAERLNAALGKTPAILAGGRAKGNTRKLRSGKDEGTRRKIKVE